MTHNGLGLGEVGEIEAQMLNKPQMLIEVQKLKFSTSVPHFGKHMLAEVFILSVLKLLSVSLLSNIKVKNISCHFSQILFVLFS